MGGPSSRGSCWLQEAAVGPVVKKTGSWALSSRPGSLTSSLSTGLRVKHLNPLTLSFLLVREICFLLGSFHRQGMSLRTLDPEELSTSPRVARLTTALSVAEALVPRAWLRIQGAALDGAQRADGYVRGGMHVQKPQPPWPARLGVGCSLPARPAAGESLGLGAFALSSGSKEEGQVTGAVTLSPALSFPMLLLLHHFGRIMVRTRCFMCRDMQVSQNSQGNGNSLNFQFAGAAFWLAETINIGAHQSVSSVTQSCPTICNPMDCSTSGLSVHHQLLELAQTHVQQVGDAIQSSHPLSPPSPPTFNLSQHQGLFK